MVCHICSLDMNEDKLLEKYLDERQSGRNREIFNDFKDSWSRAVTQYLANHGNPEQIEPIGVTDPLKSALHNLWDAPNYTAAVVKDSLRLQRKALNYCPFCGERGTPQTHDHYLPKAVFAEFSITHSNLIPMCDACQQKKGVSYLKDGVKLFLHPYFDSSEIIINLSFSNLAGQVPNIDICYDCSEQIRGVVMTHLDGLDIKHRFYSFLSKKYSSLKMVLTKSFAGKINVEDKVVKFLRMNKEIYEAENLNCWDAILYRSLSNSEEYINYIVLQCS